MSRRIFASLPVLVLVLGTATHAVAVDLASTAALSLVVGQSPKNDPSRDQVVELLDRARKAMAEGNLETAESLVSRAEGVNASFGLFHMGDTPQKVRRDLTRMKESRTGGPTTGGAPAMPPPPMPTGFAAPLPAAAPGEIGTPNAQPISATAPPAVDTFGSTRPATYPTTQPAALASLPTGDAKVQPLPMPPQESNVRLLGVAPTASTAAFVSPAATTNPPANASPAASEGKQKVLDLVRSARQALAGGNLAQAELLAREADALNVPEKEFGREDDRSWLVMIEVEKARRRGNVVQAAATSPVTGTPPYAAAQAVYDPNNDPTKVVPASAQAPAPLNSNATEASRLLNAGDEALRRNNSTVAGEMFRLAAARGDELSPAERQRLSDRLSLVGGSEPIAPGKTEVTPLIDQTAQSQELLMRQIMSDVNKLEAQAKQAQGTDPTAAQAVLQQARVLVEKSTLSAQAKELMIRRVDRALVELDKFVETNRPKIELAQRNRDVQQTLDREAQAKLQMQEKLAQLVEEYNVLIDQQRFAEAEILAKRAGEIAPDEPISLQLQVQSKSLRRMFNNAEIRSLAETGTVDAFAAVQRSSIPFNDNEPIQFPKNWAELKGKRAPFLADGARRSPKELEIEQRLKTPVSLKFDKTSLSQVFEKLSAMTGVPIYIDQRGLAAEGVDTSTPVSIDLSTEISLKSALRLILSEHHLTYVIRDEVLKITSERMRSEEVYTVTYPVGDLVIPIPNFVPTNKMGLAGALSEAMGGVMGMGGGVASNGPVSVVASNSAGHANGDVLGQVAAPFPVMAGGNRGGGASTGMPQNINFGPGGMGGGGVQPDFDSLIELITSTIRQSDWQDNGGTVGFIKRHETTLSLVITHDVRGHEEIENLLNQLRKLQDLQVTIEVRFITLSDAFYEQVGLDFDVDINDNIDRPFQIFGRPANLPTSFTAGSLAKDSGNPPRDVSDRDTKGRSVTVGMSAPGVFSSDLDIPFTQSSLTNAAGAITAGLGPGAPALVNGLAPGGANVGFAILSDIEAYFFINAVQSDQRSNVLQAPKVTMFNGQQAFVSDTVQTPFVISVIPVVGDFAVGQQPVIAVLNEGTSLSVQAVVSNDRRFVRLTMIPFFSQIGDVNEFTFEGSQTTTQNSSSETNGPGTEATTDEATTTRSGTTVQLPTFAFQTVTTTVSVPDGGTVLLGGIKRMREARFESGVPMLNKIPYLNRLFNNVAIGKSSTSLMMMVTPRIIIQEEEEAAIGVTQVP